MKETYADGVQPILASLNRLGFAVNSLAALRRLDDYRSALPLLLSALRIASNQELKEDLIRTLSVPWAEPDVARTFVDEFRKTDNFFLKWAIGNGLAIVGKDSVAQDLLELAQEKRQGRAREMVVIALSNLSDPRAIAVARSLLSDEVVQGHAVIALRKLKAKEASADVSKLAKHPKAWVRNEVKKALAAFDRE